MIRQKHRMIKSGRDTSERAMNEVFKPILTPLEKLISTSTGIKQDIKNELADIHVKKEEADDDQSFATAQDDGDQSFAKAQDDDDDDYGDDSMKKDVGLNENVESFVPAEIQSVSSPLKQHEDDDLIKTYMKAHLEQKTANRLSVRKMSDNKLMMRNSPIDFSNNAVNVANKSFPQTPGLLELLFKKTPNDSILIEYSALIIITI
ncbi:hypothetical protein PV325_007682 [Microctonus aethiopoides]|nr:hypothetical protein PV325_007682 [Microctonus aethiopoides]